MTTQFTRGKQLRAIISADQIDADDDDNDDDDEFIILTFFLVCARLGNGQSSDSTPDWPTLAYWCHTD